ncbi:MAG TPA: helix-hairpin-helix domain-containing protein [Methylomirabilota bacterium]|nr:helix-hairpin-helix domain-containing protein [Methylomirabilota bacterium]
MKTTRWLSALVVAAWCLSGGVAVGGDEKPAKAGAESKVNINEASKADLMKLAGVGPGGAQKIIEYRAAHGPFKKAQDLEKVEGIGKGVIEKNAGRIVVK